jgi:hypothetical protein
LWLTLVTNFFRFFRKRGKSIFNISDIKIFKHGILIYVKDLRWKRMQFKGIKKISLFTHVVWFVYIIRNRVGRARFSTRTWTLRKYLNFQLFSNMKKSMGKTTNIMTHYIMHICDRNLIWKPNNIKWLVTIIPTLKLKGLVLWMQQLRILLCKSQESNIMPHSAHLATLSHSCQYLIMWCETNHMYNLKATRFTNHEQHTMHTHSQKT